MFRYISPIILIGATVALFLMYTKPIFGEISTIKSEIASYDEALGNSKTLESERDKLTAKYNAINPEDLDRLQKFLPDNVDNIRLILEIEKIALPYGMALKDVKYDASLLEKKDATATTNTTGVARPGDTGKPYGVWNLEFSTEGTYTDFINFVKDLENNLRIVDISSITFSSDTGSSLDKAKSSVPRSTYGFKIKTYWLKN